MSKKINSRFEFQEIKSPNSIKSPPKILRYVGSRGLETLIKSSTNQSTDWPITTKSKMDLYWVHCNRCLILLNDALPKKIRFYVTNCTHIFCQECVNYMQNSQKCFVCPNTAVRSTPMDNNMKPDIKNAFSNVLVNIKSLYSTVDFQTKHMHNLVGTYRKNVATLGNQMRYI